MQPPASAALPPAPHPQGRAPAAGASPPPPRPPPPCRPGSAPRGPQPHVTAASAALSPGSFCSLPSPMWPRGMRSVPLHASSAGSIADRGCRPCAGRAASPHQAGGQEIVRTPRNPPPLGKAAPGRQSEAGSVLLLVPPWVEPWGLGKGPRAALQTLRGLLLGRSG